MTTSSAPDTQHLRLAARRESRRWAALVFIALGQLLLALDATIMNVALPSVQSGLGFSDAVRPWLVSAYLLAFAVLLLPGGRFADAVGQKRAFLLGLLGFALACLWGGTAPTWPQLIVARALQGACGAVIAPSALALLATRFAEPADRARAFAVYGAVAASGGALGLVLGGVLTRSVDWRWCLYVNVAFASAAWIGTWLTLDAAPPAPQRKDWAATLQGLSRDRTRRAAAAVSALAIAAMSGSFLLLTYYFQAVRRASPLETGLMFLPLSSGGMLGSLLLARRLLPRLAPRVLVGSALALAALGCLLIACLQTGSSYLWHVAPALLLLGVGVGSSMMPVLSLGTLHVEPQNAGLASALLATAQQLGGALGAALSSSVATRVTAARLGSLTPPATALVDGYRAAALTSAGLLLLALAGALSLPSAPPGTRPGR